MGQKSPSPTRKLVQNLRKYARKLQLLVPRQQPGQVPVSIPELRGVVNLLWQAAGRLEDAMPHVRLLANYACAGVDQDPDATTLCGKCGPCEARKFLDQTDVGPIPKHIPVHFVGPYSQLTLCGKAREQVRVTESVDDVTCRGCKRTGGWRPDTT